MKKHSNIPIKWQTIMKGDHGGVSKPPWLWWTRSQAHRGGRGDSTILSQAFWGMSQLGNNCYFYGAKQARQTISIFIFKSPNKHPFDTFKFNWLLFSDTSSFFFLPNGRLAFLLGHSCDRPTSPFDKPGQVVQMLMTFPVSFATDRYGTTKVVSLQQIGSFRIL